MRRLTLLPLGCLLACGGGKDSIDVKDGATDADTDTDADADTDTDTDTDTDAAYAEPTAIAVACAGTANALRFECTVDVDPPQPVAVTFARTDGLGATRTSSGDAALAEQVLPLYFMAPNQEYAVTAAAVAWPGDVAETTVTTSAAPNDVASALAATGASTMGMAGTNLPCTPDAVAVVYDTGTGDLLWYQDMDPGGTFGGNDMVVFTDEHTVLGESEGDVMEVDLMGNDLVRLPNLDAAFGVTTTGLFGNFHHDIAKHLGTYYVMYQQEYGGGGFNADVLDNLILFDGTGTELARWYAIDHLALPGNWSGDYLHMNSVATDADGNILLSFHNQATVGKFAGDWTATGFGDSDWLLRGSGGGEIGSTITIDWNGTSPTSFSQQHSFYQRPDGLYELLDNGHGRALVMDLDEATSAATVVGAYDTHEGSCGPQGTARATQAGNPVVGCSGDWLREYDAASASMIWEAEVQCPGGGGGPGAFGATRWYPLDGW